MPSKRARKRIEKRKGSNRIPKWQSKKELEEFYKQCPQDKVVDHVIPLNHPNVCGLHVISNLQYLSKEENSLKSNKWDGTLLNEGWRLLTCKSKI
jgi:5-methylcytosine-specific restriction endonuclease McrA